MVGKLHTKRTKSVEKVVFIELLSEGAVILKSIMSEHKNSIAGSRSPGHLLFVFDKIVCRIITDTNNNTSKKRYKKVLI